MPIELKMLVWCVALTIVQMLVQVGLSTGQVDGKILAGNREDMPKLKSVAFRAQRAHLNMLENLPLFAIVVLVAYGTGVGNATTEFAAQLFFYSRLAFWIIFLIGIPYLRSVAFAGGLAALVIYLKVLLIG